MNNSERRDREMVYITDLSVLCEQQRARRLTQRMNRMNTANFLGLAHLAKKLFGKTGKNVFVNPPFHCDYGSHIEVGENFFANYNCCIIDVGKVVIGDNCLIAPNVSIYTAGHPLHPDTRSSAYEFGIDVHIGDNVWLGGNAVICPGVTIGSNTVIAAGSVVTKDVPGWVLAGGNPCRVIRPITEADRRLYYKDRQIDDEAWAVVMEKSQQRELKREDAD